MKKLVLFMAAAVMMMACGTKAEKTIENLKTAATGETNASAHYALYAAQAEADSMFNVAAMFRATSAAEKIHAAAHMAVLKELGVVDFQPVVEEIEVKTTAENLATAKSGEEYEYTEMYPSFIEVAKTEKVDNAVKSFSAAMTAEQKHAGFYGDAANAIAADGNDLNAVGAWVVCPVCGDTYNKADSVATCQICGAPASSFMIF